MARKLTAAEAARAFEEVVRGLAKQHLRLRFRRSFGTGELMDATTMIKAAVVAPSDRPVTNLLHEVPEGLTVTRLTGNVDALEGEVLETPSSVTIGEILAAADVEQALIVMGRKARLLAYFDPTESHVYVARETVVIPVEPKPKLRPAPRARRKPAPRVKRRR